MGKFRKLGRHASHRVSMLRTMVSQLVKHERIETTVAKAKEVRRKADQMVQLGKESPPPPPVFQRPLFFAPVPLPPLIRKAGVRRRRPLRLLRSRKRRPEGPEPHRPIPCFRKHSEVRDGARFGWAWPANTLLQSSTHQPSKSQAPPQLRSLTAQRSKRPGTARQAPKSGWARHHHIQRGEARNLLDRMPYRDVVSATAAIGALTRRGRHRDAFALFSRVLADGVAPNEFTFGTIFRSATTLRDLRAGAQLHACATKLGLCSNVFVGSALVDHYAKMGAMREAQGALEDTSEPNVVSYTALTAGLLNNGMSEDAVRLFRRMPERNVVSWNAMIGGCSQAGLSEEAVALFLEMCREGVRPNESTFPCVLTSVATLVHSVLAEACGSLDDSVLAFKKMKQKNVVSWNALICGLAQNGRGQEALDAYNAMRATGLKADHVTLLGLLFGCNHAGLVDEGYALFKAAQMEQPGILKPEHYACVVDILSRAKRFDDAKRFLEELPFEPGIGFWKALVGGCQIHWNRELAESVANHIHMLDPKDTSSYILLSNVYSAAGSWQSVSMVRREIKEKGLKRITGCSWIEVQDKVHVFFNGDRRHPQTDEIYMILELCLDTRENKESVV
ncbi:hypothetical protein PR202_gb04266 [Eleusine coracana subsp. coracana]|uniref:Pentatricopeptide repeat-containing protein n=1 Tax=Eleusine coracana subsp. coracana TaxID=191504 RepID=A0AAV5E4X4_ELECO|nr:hypothetical protein PR202_gb04266 [Eleusine coracana subsp. coracana]